MTNAVAGCPDFSEVNLNVIATPTITVGEVKCAGDLQSWEATVTSSGVPTSSEGNLVSLGGNQYRIENITLNSSLQVSVSSGNGLCTTTIDIASADCACTISVRNLPLSVDLCPDESITLQPQVNDPKGSVTSFWIVGNDSLYQTTLQVTQAGSYEFVAKDALGCKENQIVNVSYYQEMIPGVSWVDITCPGDRGWSDRDTGDHGWQRAILYRARWWGPGADHSVPLYHRRTRGGTYQPGIDRWEQF